MAYDIHWNEVVLAMHMDDTGLTDVKGHTVTLNGNVARSATQSKFGGYSAYFDGTGDYLSVPYSSAFDFGAGDFTIEFWLYRTGTNAATSRLWNAGGDYYHQVEIGLDSAGALGCYGSINGSTWSAWSSPSIGSITANTWIHVAVVRSGGTVTAYVGGSGVVLTSALGSVALVNGSGASSIRTIGGQPGTDRPYQGYIDDLRITKGFARYTANFTPPASAFADRLPFISGVVRDSANNLAQRLVRVHDRATGALLGQTLSNATTGAYSVDLTQDSEVYAVAHDTANADLYGDKVVLAMHMDDTGLTDVKGHTVTLNGNAARSAAQSKFGGYSAYFDGTGDYLSLADSTDFDLGSGDFTIEMFVYTGSAAANLIGKRLTAGYAPFSILITAGKLNARFSTNGTTFGVDISSTTSINTSAWVHVAVTRTGTNVRMFVGGTSQSSTGTLSGAVMTNTSGVYIGANSDASAPLTGYIDDLRVTKGVARYTADFTPPTAAFVDGISDGTSNAVILDRLVPA